MLTKCMFHCSTVNIQAGELAETIHVQSSALELSSKKFVELFAIFSVMLQAKAKKLALARGPNFGDPRWLLLCLQEKAKEEKKLYVFCIKNSV